MHDDKMAAMTINTQILDPHNSNWCHLKNSRSAVKCVFSMCSHVVVRSECVAGGMVVFVCVYIANNDTELSLRVVKSLPHDPLGQHRGLAPLNTSRPL